MLRSSFPSPAFCTLVCIRQLSAKANEQICFLIHHNNDISSLRTKPTHKILKVKTLKNIAYKSRAHARILYFFYCEKKEKLMNYWFFEVFRSRYKTERIKMTYKEKILLHCSLRVGIFQHLYSLGLT